MKKTIPEYYRFTIRHYQRGGGFGEIATSIQADTMDSAIAKLAKKYPYEVAHCVRAFWTDSDGYTMGISHFYIRTFAK